MPLLNIVAKITIQGVDQTVETSTIVSDQDILDLIPITNVDNPSWGHLRKAEEICITCLAKNIFPDEITSISNSNDLQRMNVTKLSVIFSDEDGNSNSLTFISNASQRTQ